LTLLSPHLGLPASLKKENKSNRVSRKGQDVETLVWTLGGTQAQARSLGVQPEAVGAHAAPVRRVGPCGSGIKAASSPQGSHDSHLRLFKAKAFSETICRISVTAGDPPNASRIIRNAMTY